MTRRDWWLGVGVVVAAIVLHALVPRYEWRNANNVPRIRVDRWTGQSVLGTFSGGRWVSLERGQHSVADLDPAFP
jgi:hypothetical protein